jgi:hypothetical protein
MHLRSLLNPNIKLSPSYFILLYQLSNVYLSPIPAHKSRIAGLRGRRMIEQLLDCSLCEGRVSLGAWRVSKVFCEARAVIDRLSKGGRGALVSRWSFGRRGWLWHFWDDAIVIWKAWFRGPSGLVSSVDVSLLRMQWLAEGEECV